MGLNFLDFELYCQILYGDWNTFQHSMVSRVFDYAWIFLILNCTIKLYQVKEILFTLDDFTSFWLCLNFLDFELYCQILSSNWNTFHTRCFHEFFFRAFSEIALWLLTHRKRKLISVIRIKVFCENTLCKIIVGLYTFYKYKLFCKFISWII